MLPDKEACLTLFMSKSWWRSLMPISHDCRGVSCGTWRRWNFGCRWMWIDC